jgi:hypothetical protein
VTFFKMPELSYNDVGAMVKRALDAACWDLSGQREHPDDPRWAESVEESRAELEAWVNYQRQAFPDMESGCMLDYERHWSPRLPFERGQDLWVFNVTENSWVVVKPKGKRVVTRKPRDQK